VAAGFGLVEDGQDGIYQGAGSFGAEFDGDAGAGALGFVDEVDVQGMFHGRVEGVVVGDVDLTEGEPAGCAFAAAVDFYLFDDHGTHGGAFRDA